MRRNIDAAVAFCTGKAKHVVILVDGAAHRAQTVVAVGEHVGDGEPLQSRCPGCLDDAHKGNVMRSQLVEFQLQLLHIVRCVVCFQNTVGDGLLCSFLLGRHCAKLCLQGSFLSLFHDLGAVQQPGTAPG